MQATIRTRRIVARQGIMVVVLSACLLAGGGCAKKPDPAAEARARDADIAAALASAGSQLAAGKTADGIAALEKLHQANPDRADVTEALAFADVNAGRHPQAAVLFEEAARLDPARGQLLVYAAGLDEDAGDHTGAARVYQAYLKLFPQDAPAWKNLAKILNALGQTQNALDAYLESFNRSSRKPTAADDADLAALFLQAGNTAQAEAWFTQSLQLQPDAATAARAQLGLLDLAVRAQDMAKAGQIIATLDANAVSRAALDASPLAGTRDKVKQWQQAQDAAAQLAAEAAKQAAVPPPPPEPETPVVVAAPAPVEAPPPPPAPVDTPASRAATIAADAHKLSDDGKLPDAIALYWKALGEDNSDPAIWLALGQACLANKQLADAVSIAREAIRRAPDDPAYTVFYLQTVKSSDTPARYQSELIAAYEKFPASADVAFSVADALESQGDTRDAATIYRNFIIKAPDDPRRDEAETDLANLPPAN